MRSLGLLVDVTQYVMLEIGQPLHAFDADRLGKSTIEVRRAKAGEKIAGLDGGTHVLTSEDMVIANESGVVALAGVVGGTQTAVHAGTTKILLESASFQAGRVRKTARRFSLPTESGRRFGRGGIDACLVDQASERVRQILHECGALTQEEGVTRAGSMPKAKEDEIILRSDRVEKILGWKMDSKEISARLVALGFHARGHGWVPPSWRMDIREEVDLLEELIRCSDLDKVPSFLDALAEGESAEDRQDGERRQIRRFLVERGYFEVLGGSLIRADEGMSVALSTASGPEVGAYRESLVSGLLSSAARNISRGQTDLKLFEIGRVTGAKGREEMRLALLITGCQQVVSWQGGEECIDHQVHFTLTLIIQTSF
jgi:phenylalanyl-tRNA synthetase beta chain